MKIYMNRPKNNWLSPYTILEKVVFWREVDYDEPMVKFWNKVLTPFCSGLFTLRNLINRDIRYIQIDPWDAWSIEHTLSPIILPMLQELKRVKHGAPFVADEDVPPKLRANKGVYKGNADPDLHRIEDDVDSKFFRRFDYILDEMIWTFEQLHPDNDWESQYYSGEHDIVWEPKGELDEKGKPKFYEMKKGPKDTFQIDMKGMRKHQKRIDNGLRLFGKYYCALWD